MSTMTTVRWKTPSQPQIDSRLVEALAVGVVGGRSVQTGQTERHNNRRNSECQTPANTEPETVL